MESTPESKPARPFMSTSKKTPDSRSVSLGLMTSKDARSSAQPLASASAVVVLEPAERLNKGRLFKVVVVATNKRQVMETAR